VMLDTQITDAGMEYLKGLTGLPRLELGTDARLPKGSVWLNAWRAKGLFDDFSVRLLP
jgi:hypothetical protein